MRLHAPAGITLFKPDMRGERCRQANAGAVNFDDEWVADFDDPNLASPAYAEGLQPGEIFALRIDVADDGVGLRREFVEPELVRKGWRHGHHGMTLRRRGSGG